jgi:hypothetical protein
MMLGGAVTWYDCRAHQFGALPDVLTRRAAESGGGAIHVADNTVLEHVVAVADMASLGVRGGRSQVDLVEIIKPANAGVVLTDPGIVHDHATHAPFGRIEGIVPAAIGPGDDDVRAMLVANKRAAGNCQDLYVLICSAHRLVLHDGYSG